MLHVTNDFSDEEEQQKRITRKHAEIMYHSKVMSIEITFVEKSTLFLCSRYVRQNKLRQIRNLC